MSKERMTGWGKEARELIDRTYKKFKLEYMDIMDILDPLHDQYEEDEIVAAVRAHIMDARERDHSIVGKWVPSTAELVWHLQNMRKEEARLKKDSDQTSRVISIPKSNIVALDVPAHMKKYFKRDYVEVYTDKSADKFVDCSVCHDTGRAYFYRAGLSSDNSDQVDVYTKQEYLDMSEATIKILKLNALQCICTCDKGEELWSAWGGKRKRPWHLKQVEQYAHNRKAREGIA